MAEDSKLAEESQPPQIIREINLRKDDMAMAIAMVSKCTKKEAEKAARGGYRTSLEELAADLAKDWLSMNKMLSRYKDAIDVLDKIASCQSVVKGDVVSLAQDAMRRLEMDYYEET